MSGLQDKWEKMLSVEGTDAKGIAFAVSYNDHAHKFRVDVSHGDTNLSEEFNASYRPRFGMDVEDHQQAMAIAEKLALKIEQDLKL